MSDEAADKLEESLKGYKKDILEVTKGSLEWERDLNLQRADPDGV